jgi:hypothetical protein
MIFNIKYTTPPNTKGLSLEKNKDRSTKTEDFKPLVTFLQNSSRNHVVFISAEACIYYYNAKILLHHANL